MSGDLVEQSATEAVGGGSHVQLTRAENLHRSRDGWAEAGFGGPESSRTCFVHVPPSSCSERSCAWFLY